MERWGGVFTPDDGDGATRELLLLKVVGEDGEGLAALLDLVKRCIRPSPICSPVCSRVSTH